MKKISRIFVLVGCIASVTSGWAQEAAKDAPEAKQPDITAEQVLDKYIDATGSRQAYEKITSTTSKGTIDLPTQGIHGTVEFYAKAPNKRLEIATIQGIGEIKKGYDGQAGWSQDPFQGTRDMDGVELASFKRQAVFNAELKWRELYEKAELVGTNKVGDRDAYVVRLTPSVGKPITQYYDTQTFLLVRMDLVQEGPQGTIPVETYLSEYRDVDGVKLPFQLTEKTPIGEATLKVTEVKNNIPIDDAKFAKPAVSAK
jgi:hypothetical protein